MFQRVNQFDDVLILYKSRRDDLESLGYILVSLMGRRLPWQGIRKATKVQRNEAIGDIKESISPNDICKDLPRMVGQRNLSNTTISNAVRYLK